tara:strand:- start:178 stop:462 length:285 start_codon:yes stop_codon:yes gene_type:complete
LPRLKQPTGHLPIVSQFSWSRGGLTTDGERTLLYSEKACSLRLNKVEESSAFLASLFMTGKKPCLSLQNGADETGLMPIDHILFWISEPFANRW